MRHQPAQFSLSKNAKSGLWDLRDDQRKKLIASFAKKKDALMTSVLEGRKRRWGYVVVQDKSGTWEQRHFGRWPSKKSDGYVDQ